MRSFSEETLILRSLTSPQVGITPRTISKIAIKIEPSGIPQVRTSGRFRKDWLVGIILLLNRLNQPVLYHCGFDHKFGPGLGVVEGNGAKDRLSKQLSAFTAIHQIPKESGQNNVVGRLSLDG